jgi:hypothetical protein
MVIPIEHVRKITTTVAPFFDDVELSWRLVNHRGRFSTKCRTISDVADRFVISFSLHDP